MGYSNFQEASSFLERYAQGEYLDWSPTDPVPSFAKDPSFTYLKPPEPPKERERLQAVWDNDPNIRPNFESLARKAGEKLKVLAELAISTFQVDAVAISLIDDRALRIKASFNFPEDITSRADTFCAHTILRNGCEPTVVHDTKKDWRFAKHPLVTRDGGYRFWSGVPLRTEGGHNIGAFSIFSRTPRPDFGPEEAHIHFLISLISIREFEFYNASRCLARGGRFQTAISHFSQKSTTCKSSHEIFQLAIEDISKGLEMDIAFIVEIFKSGGRPTFYLQSSVGLDVPRLADDKLSRESISKDAEGLNQKEQVTGDSLLKALSVAHSHQGHTVIISADEADLNPKPANINFVFSEDCTIDYFADSCSVKDPSKSNPADPSKLSQFPNGRRTRPERSGFAIGAYASDRTRIVGADHLQFLLDFGVAFQSALELYRTRTILRINEKKLQREKDLLNSLILNILPPAFTEMLIEGKRAIAETYPSCTIIFADIVNFTALTTHRSARQIVVLLNRLFCRLDLIAAHLGIEKVKTIGDSYMAGAGFPEALDDHARVVAEFALAIIATVRDFNKSQGENLQIRIGFDSGPLMAGVIGRTKFAYDIWGNTVNIAKRLEAASEPDHINVGQASYELLKDLYHFENRGFAEVKGVGVSTMYFLKGRIHETESESHRPPEEELAEMFRDVDADGISGIPDTAKSLSKTMRVWNWGDTPTVSPSGSPLVRPQSASSFSTPSRDLGHAHCATDWCRRSQM